nr:putative peptidase S10, serine carboxypeptidase, alpha/beta hydrolase fold protein [Tanacetum cinerariifolium]
MEFRSITLSLLIIFVHFLSVSNSKSIVKSLPGFHGDLPFTFETGYVGVGNNDEIQFFYYFVESQRDPLHDPVLLYLTGGPGTSGLFPLLYQIGPLSISDESSKGNEANVIFLDLPAGVGFSYATTYEASSSSDSLVSLHSYQFLMKVYKGNERGNKPQVNIKGYSIVSPLTDRFIDFNSRLEFQHRLALISDEIYESTKQTCRGNYVYIDPSNALCSHDLERVDECTSGINYSNVLEPMCDDVNPAPACPAATKIVLDSWANDKDVQKALHVRQGTIEIWEKTNETIHYTLGKNDTASYSYDIFSTIDHHKQLTTRNCQVLIISGDHDMTFPYVGTEQWIASLNVPVESPWKPWFVGSQVSGYKIKYAKKGYSLTYATIKGAGHAVALNRPTEALAIVDGGQDKDVAEQNDDDDVSDIFPREESYHSNFSSDDEVLNDEGETYLKTNKSPIMKVNSKFVNVVQFRRALNHDAIKNESEYLIEKSEPTRFMTRCANLQCKWEIHAYSIEDGITFKLSKWIMKHYNVDLPYQKVFRGKEQAYTNIHGERLWNSIQNGPYVGPMIPGPDGAVNINGTVKQILEPLSKMTEVDACKNAKDIWERIKMLMFSSDGTSHVRHSRLMDEFEKFVAKEGESLEYVYERLTTLVNIMDHNNVCPISV